MRPMKNFEENFTSYTHRNKNNVFSIFFLFLNYMKRPRKGLRSNNIPAVRASSEFKTIVCNMRITLHNYQ